MLLYLHQMSLFFSQLESIIVETHKVSEWESYILTFGTYNVWQARVKSLTIGNFPKTTIDSLQFLHPFFLNLDQLECMCVCTSGDVETKMRKYALLAIILFRLEG